MQALRHLYGKLRLQVNEEKSAVARVWDRQFLGYSFWVAAGKVVKRRVSKKALTKFKERVRQITSRSGGRSLQQVAEELRRYVLGWKAYFGLADTPGVFRDLDQWIHRRLRTLQLRQWKRGRTAYRELRARGVSENLAWRAARFALLIPRMSITHSAGCRSPIPRDVDHRFHAMSITLGERRSIAVPGLGVEGGS